MNNYQNPLFTNFPPLKNTKTHLTDCLFGCACKITGPYFQLITNLMNTHNKD
ncbi:hypothetical protein THERMOT_499 [Bathymodiolus thermophilus thioautotrophic gill symbiont]|nr:hypothetical protein THERMOT_499 [Bathymodiolus thermophilus thioautotrophic gill symbiont]